MRLHCMDVFHYVANELKDVPLFENVDDSMDCLVGSIYNDFDCTPLSLLEDEEDPFQFAEISNSCVSEPTQNDDLLEEVVEDAIFDADECSGVLYEHTVSGSLM